jgi:hypothetical protein
MKIHTVTSAMLCLAALTTGACVMPSTYGEAIADLDATKVELNSSRIESQVLTEQVRDLQQLKIDRAKHMEAAALALQRARERMRAEHSISQARLNRLARRISQLNLQQKRLLYDLHRANQERPVLQSAIEEYKSKLSEADGPGAPLSPPSGASTSEQAKTAPAPTSQVVAPIDPAPKPAVTTSVASLETDPVKPKLQPTNQQPPSEPVESDWLSTLKGWVISFWQSIFI